MCATSRESWRETEGVGKSMVLPDLHAHTHLICTHIHIFTCFSFLLSPALCPVMLLCVFLSFSLFSQLSHKSPSKWQHRDYPHFGKYFVNFVKNHPAAQSRWREKWTSQKLPPVFRRVLDPIACVATAAGESFRERILDAYMLIEIFASTFKERLVDVFIFI